MKVLVVDDDDGVRDVIQFSLEAVAGWTTLATNSGQEGIAIAKSQQPDLILLDMMMPDEDGIAVLKQLQSDPLTQSIPIIFLTAKAQMIEKEKIIGLGSKGLIMKPFKAQDLVQQIKQILNW